MIREGVIVPFFDLHLRGRYACPLRCKPANVGKNYKVKYGPYTVGVLHEPFEVNMNFEFEGNAYFDTWIDTDPGHARLYLSWESDEGDTLYQTVTLQLRRKVTKSYWDDNWRNHHWSKTNGHSPVEFFMPPMYKRAHCPKCGSLETTLYMRYDAKEQGWMCEACYQPSLSAETTKARRRQKSTLAVLEALRNERNANAE